MPPQSNYNPDIFEYDDELPEGQYGERVILSDEPVPREIGVIKTIGTRKAGFEITEDQICDWDDDEDEDEARISAFLAS